MFEFHCSLEHSVLDHCPIFKLVELACIPAYSDCRYLVSDSVID